MTTIYAFKSIAMYLLLSTQVVTVLNFDSKIEKVYHGKNKMDLFVKTSKDKKTLILKPLIPKLSTNMVVITKSGNFNFNVKIDEDRPHNFIEIKNGKKDTSFREVLNTSEYTILEGKNSIEIIPRKKILVNEKELLESTRFPKGSPVYVNSKRVLY